MSILVQDISKAFGATRVLEAIDLKIGPGELVSLLGPSGCGKTTLLRIIAGLESSDSGRIHLDGIDVTDLGARDRQVGFVFQHYALFRHLSVFENVAFGLRVKPRRERPDEDTIRRTVTHLLERVQLEAFKDRYPAQLSGGQRQRVALARALAIEPRVLLLDEPFGALDAKVRKELRKWLRRLHDELHVTSVFVTHDQDEALEVSDTVVLMNRGRIEQKGSPEDVHAQPATPFAYGFLGDVNRFDATVEAGGLATPAGHVPWPGLEGHAAGSSVTVFVRPADFDLHGINNGSDGLIARVDRVLTFDQTARVELTSVQGEPVDFEVHCPSSRVPGLARGDQVRLVPRKLRVFADA